MAKIDSSSGSPFASINDDIQANRSRVAQFAIYRAAQHLSDGNQDEAIREIKNALAFDPQNVTAHTYLGKIHQSKGDEYPSDMNPATWEISRANDTKCGFYFEPCIRKQDHAIGRAKGDGRLLNIQTEGKICAVTTGQAECGIFSP